MKNENSFIFFKQFMISKCHLTFAAYSMALENPCSLLRQLRYYYYYYY